MVVLNADGEVRAAGGAVVRHRDGLIEVLLVHRPAYDDWSLPKGKAEPAETDEECALREVREETGLVCELGDELPAVRYTDRFGRPKVARYWAMTAVEGAFEPHGEVDDVRWMPLPDAIRMLSYEHDAEVIRALQ